MKIDLKYSNFIIPKDEKAFDGIIDFFKKYQANLGWIDVNKLVADNLEDLQKEAEFIKNNCQIFIVIGIGGSYLGSKAIIESLAKAGKPEIIFFGNSLASNDYHEIAEKINNNEVIVNYISKSGRTLETNVAFQYVLDLLKEKYSIDELSKRIIYTTNNEKILQQAPKKFSLPQNVGGRFSVFTAAGLLPLLVANVDVSKLIKGANEANIEMVKEYALFRYYMQKEGKMVEAFVAYKPQLRYLLEWIKQLLGESLGKMGQGLLPISLINTTDLHSLGQYVQEGRRMMIETVISFPETTKICIPKYQRSLGGINQLALYSTAKAHSEGGVPNLIIENDKLDEFSLGKLMQFMMIACVMGGYLEGVNPFDQPGVEIYKRELLNELTIS